MQLSACMKKKMVYVSFLVLAAGLNGNAYSTSIQGGSETVIASDLKVASYISKVLHFNNETFFTQDQVRHGYEIVERGDGTCYKRTTVLHSMKDIKTSDPAIVIQGPKTITETKDVDCNVSTLANAQ